MSTEAMQITAREFSEIDIETRVNWINNPKINYNMFFEIPATVEKTLQWHRSNIGNKKRIDFTFRDEAGTPLAMGGFTGIDEANENAEFYVMVNPEMHGKGIGKKVSKWMFNYFFLRYGLNKIYLYTNDSNVSAYKIYEDCDFKLEGIFREQKFKNGSFQNRRFYGLLKREWINLDWKVDQIYFEF